MLGAHPKKREWGRGGTHDKGACTCNISNHGTELCCFDAVPPPHGHPRLPLQPLQRAQGPAGPSVGGQMTEIRARDLQPLAGFLEGVHYVRLGGPGLWLVLVLVAASQRERHEHGLYTAHASLEPKYGPAVIDLQRGVISTRRAPEEDTRGQRNRRESKNAGWGPGPSALTRLNST